MLARPYNTTVFTVDWGVDRSAAAANANATVEWPDGIEESEYFKPFNILKFDAFSLEANGLARPNSVLRHRAIVTLITVALSVFKPNVLFFNTINNKIERKMTLKPHRFPILITTFIKVLLCNLLSLI
jgi:hypothetical protein